MAKSIEEERQNLLSQLTSATPRSMDDMSEFWNLEMAINRDLNDDNIGRFREEIAQLLQKMPAGKRLSWDEAREMAKEQKELIADGVVFLQFSPDEPGSTRSTIRILPGRMFRVTGRDNVSVTIEFADDLLLCLDKKHFPENGIPVKEASEKT